MEKSTKLTKKRLLALLLTIVMVFGMIPGNVIAVETEDQNLVLDDNNENELQLLDSGEETVLINDPETSEPPMEIPTIPETTDPTEAEEITYGKVDVYTGGKISGNETASVNVTITDTTLQWHEADEALGRSAGWWVGISATAPENVTVEELEKATYTVDGATMSFNANKDGDRYIQLWYPVTPEGLAKGTNLVKTYVFDWDGTGNRNQTINFVVVPSDKIVLMKDGRQVYPITYGEVGTYTGGTVSGNATASVNVTITEITLQWQEADATVDRTAGWWVGISATAPENVTVEELEKATYTVDGATKSFNANKDGDRYIQLWYPVTPEGLAKGTNLVKTYVFDWDGTGNRNQTINFVVVPSEKIVLMKDGMQVKGYNINFAESDKGYFTNTAGERLDNYLYTTNGTDAKFGFQLNEGLSGYDVEIWDGDTKLTAEDGIYTIAYVTKAHNVKSVLRDIQEPTLSVEVEDAESWKKTKNIQITATDNSDSLRIYVARNEYITLEALRANAHQDVEEVTGSYAATEDGSYYIYAVDGADLWKMTSVEVTKIDTIQPEMVGKLQIVDVVDAEGVATTHYTITVKDEGGSGVHTVYYAGVEEPKSDELQSVKSDSDVYKISWPANDVCYVWIHDYAGNITAVGDLPANKVTIDKIHLPTSWQKDEYKIWIDSDDAEGVYMSTLKKENLEDISNFTQLVPMNNSYPVTVTGNGTYYIYALDEDGNWDRVSVEMTLVDSTAPVITSITHNPEPVEGNLSDWHNGGVTLTVAIEEVGSGIDRVEYYTRDTGGTVTERLLAVYDEESGTATVTVPAEDFVGSYIFEAFDNVGHVSNRESTSVAVDMTKPDVLTAEYDVSESSSFFWREVINVVSFNLIFENKVSIHVTGQDVGGIGASGIAKYQYQFVDEKSTITDDGWKDRTVSNKERNDTTINVTWSDVSFIGKVYLRAWDEAGNVSGPKAATRNDREVTIVVDNKVPAAPEVALKVADTTYTGEWTNANVIITLSGGDTASGVKAYQYRIGEDGAWTDMPETTETHQQKADAMSKVKDQLIIDADTNAPYYFRTVSNAELASEETEAVHIKVWKSLPENAEVELTEPNGINGWYVNYDALGIKLREPDVNELAAPVTTYYKLWNEGKGEAEPETGIVFNGENHPVITEKDGDGIYILKVWTVDKAGNQCAESDIITKTIQVDTTPEKPTVNLNGYKAGTWTNQDVMITLSGGDNHFSGVKVYQYRIGEDGAWTDMPETTGTHPQKADATTTVKDRLIIKADTNVTYYFRAISNTEIEGYETAAVQVKVQKTLPANAEVTLAAPNGTDGWYVSNENTGAGRFSAPGIALREPDVDKLAAPVTTYYKLWNEGEDEAEPETGIVFNGKQPVIKADGIHKLKVWTVDEAGNQCTEESIIEKTIYVDTTDPKDLKVYARYEGSTAEGDDLLTNENLTLGYRIYNHKITINFDAADETSGLASFLYKKENSESTGEEQWMPYPDGGIEISPNERFIIYFKAVDKAGNDMDVNSQCIILDDKAPSSEETNDGPDVFATLGEDNRKTVKGDDGEYDIYNGNVTVAILAYDPKYIAQEGAENGYYSGLKNISYEIFAEDIGKEEKGSLFEASEKDDELEDAYSGTISINAETFNSNNVYLKITATDNADNLSERTFGPIKIDVTRPVIDVSYNLTDPSNGQYYNAKRTATITIQERNWRAEDVVITVTKDTKPFTEYTFKDWEKSTEDTGNGDKNEYEATITFDSDGDYTLNIAYTDLAGKANEGVTTNAEKIGDEFTIDMTQPTVTVTYDNNNVANEKYFKETRTAKVNVVEHNFDAGKVEITIGTNRGGKKPSYSFRPGKEKDTYFAEIEYLVDGDYTFAIEVTDLASNKNKPVDYGTSAAAKDFVIDTTYEDMITIGGVENGKAYGYTADVIPTINISDINLEEYSISLIGVQKDATTDLTAKITAMLKTTSETVTGSFDIFEVVQDMDGIYTLSATALDKAKNQDAEKVVFTVNRFGSVYVYNDYLMKLIANGGTYEQKITDDLVITEYNADKLLTDSLAIEITCDGKPLDNVIYDVTPEMNNTVAVGESGWYQYKYTISKENFVSDGVYKISVSTKDATGNAPENNRYEDMGITFYVDSTPAEISSIVGLEEAIINATEQNVRYTVYDTMGLKSIKVYVDGELINDITDFGADMNNYSGSFTLLEKTSAQSVRIVVMDLSGNITDTEAEDFVSAYEFERSVTVSTNIFVRWYANKPLFWGSVGGTAVLVAALWYALVAKRKKKEAAAK